MKELKVKKYTRTIHLKDVTFVCSDCKQQVTEQQYPGPKRSVCRTCLEDPERERRLARERQRRRRARGKESHEA